MSIREIDGEEDMNCDFYLFPNPSRDPWIQKYNLLVSQIKTGKTTFSIGESRLAEKVGNHYINRLGVHHIIPRSLNKNLEKDPRNMVELPFKEHMNLHYFLWKADKRYARQLWFGCVFGRKYGLWDLPGGDEEYRQLKNDLRGLKRKR